MATGNEDQFNKLSLHLGKLFLDQKEEIRRQHEALMKEMQEQKNEDRKRLDAQDRQIEELKKTVLALSQQLPAEDREIEELKKTVLALSQQLPAEDREIEELQKTAPALSQQLAAVHTFPIGEMPTFVKEVAETRIQSASMIQINDQMGSLDKVLLFLLQQPTWKKVAIVVGGAVVCGLTVYGLLYTAPGTAILGAIWKSPEVIPKDEGWISALPALVGLKLSTRLSN